LATIEVAAPWNQELKKKLDAHHDSVVYLCHGSYLC